MSERTADDLDEDAMEEVERLRFENGVMADELTDYAMREALLLECLKDNGIDPPEGCRA